MKKTFTLKRLVALFAIGMIFSMAVPSSIGACEPAEIPGCTNSEAVNYNPDATIDDDSCEYKSIRIISPVEGALWICGKDYGIRWYSEHIDNVDIELHHSSLGMQTIATGVTATDGIYTILAEDYTPGEDFYVKVKDSSDSSVYADSGYFDIIGCEIEGCTDSEATNYDPEATVDDGFCEYAHPTGSITVCKIITDDEGNIVDGSEVPGVEFSIFNTLFTTPLTLNADLIGNDQINDAQCVVYDGLEYGSHWYEEEVYPNEGWMTPLYNDQFTTTVDSLDDLLPFDINDDNVDGDIVLSSSRPNRTLIVLNQYEETSDPKEQACIDSGGTVSTSLCCLAVGDFPNLCATGACGCAPGDSHEVKICDCGPGKCFDGETCVTIDVSGCTDPEATNYNSEATVDDGSCEYEDICTPDSPNWGELDRVDIGNLVSEATHYIDGWSLPNIPGNYGGCQQGAVCTYRQVLESPDCSIPGNCSSPCTDNERGAYFVLDTGDSIASKIVVRHLDGISLMDSFDLYLGDILIGHWEDETQIVSEIWRETEFDISQYSFHGSISFKIRATDEIWSGCPTYGQVAIDWISVEGCDSSQPTGSITVCKIITDSEGNIVDGSEVLGAEFSIFNTLFTTPLALNADLIGNDQINDAQCVVYDNLAFGTYWYEEEIYPEEGWMVPLYNDQYITIVDSLDDLLPFNPDDGNVDGQITVSQSRLDRTLVVLNQYEALDIEGCTDPEANNYNEEATIDDDSCTYDIPGCTNPEALNYDPEATKDDGSCQYPPSETPGCMDPEANNYDEEATVDDGSCEYDIEGCTDPEANNYNEEATIDDDSCTYDVSGCTDSGALNYNPDATVDDGSCEYGGGGGGGGVTLIKLRIFNEQTGDPSTLTVTLTWQTNVPATSRVIYDTVSHSELGEAPNYGYAYSTEEDTNKVVVHSVTISGLLPNTTYYWRPISKASPEVWGDELVFSTGEPVQPPAEIPGCMDNTALNYDEDATVDDGSCEYSQPGPGPEPTPEPEPERETGSTDVFGCTDDTALNYNPEATINDDSCEYAEEPEFTLDLSDEEEEEQRSGLLAAIGGLFTKENICWLLLALIIIIIALFIFSERKENPGKERERKLYFLIIVAILMIIYYFLSCNCFYCWIVILVLLAIAVISMFFKGEKKEEIEY